MGWVSWETNSEFLSVAAGDSEFLLDSMYFYVKFVNVLWALKTWVLYLLSLVSALKKILVKIYFSHILDLLMAYFTINKVLFLHWNVYFAWNFFGEWYKIEVQIYFLVMDNIPVASLIN